jgi:tRNA-specific 2-thiouridylase
MQKVLVGMSGGIDSTVVAWMLKKRGYQVTGVTMSIWKPDRPFHGDPNRDSCFAPSEKHDIKKTKALCDRIGIEHIVLDISDLYEQTVLKNFRDEYLSGRTPNPCVWCNQKIKFGAMVDIAREKGLDFDYFATGHYARIEKLGERYALKKGLDAAKDQSYFLYRLSQKQLSTTLFPLGSYTKDQIRKIDLENGFHPENQTESQDFYSGPYSDLLGVEAKTGNIVDTKGKVLGKHNGMWNYTIGQRRGLGIAADRPLYVIALRPSRNEVVVGYEEDTKNTVVTAANVNWVAVSGLEKPVHATAKIRSAGNAALCTVTQLEDGRIQAVFDSPVNAATCGQSLVVYDNDTVLCGGIIDSAD